MTGRIDYALSAKRVLLTGGAGGLGLPMARALLMEGAHVLLTALEPEALEGARSSLFETPGRIETIAANLADPSAIDAILAAAEDRFGGVDILVNNAGIGPGAVRPDFWNEKIRFWEAGVDFQLYAQINFIAGATLAQRLAPAMIDRGWGRIINVTTSLATMLGRGCAPYGPTKAAAEALTSVQAHDLVGTGVTANVMTPGGPADTPMVSVNPAVDRSSLIRPSVMAPVVRWVASPRSDGTTGRRFIAALWDASLDDETAAERASAPAGWPV